MDKILILGAGISQVPLIKKAREMGLYTIVSSIEGNYPGFKLADKVYHVNTTNREECLNIALNESISAVCTTGTDVAIGSLAYICDNMNLPGISTESADYVSDKSKMKKLFDQNGIKTAGFRIVRNVNECFDACRELEMPLIFKIVDSSGSRGIKIVRDEKSSRETYRLVSSVTKKDYIIVEEYLEGIEFGAQAFIFNGKIKFILPHGDYVFRADTGIPVGHYAPLDIAGDIILQTNELIGKSAESIGLNNCAVNADFILKDMRVHFLEIGARAGANCLVELVSIYFGFDYYEKIIEAALGIEPDFTQGNITPNASKILYSKRDGIIKSITNKNKPNENIVEISFDYKAQDYVRRFRTGPDRIGQVIVKESSLEKAKALLEETVRNIEIAIE